MDEKQKTSLHSRTSVVGLFMVISFVLTIPLAVLLSQERQDIRGRGAEPTQPLLSPTQIPQSGAGINVISGYVYADKNQDGQRQLEEKPFPAISVKLTQVKKNGNNPNTGTQTTEIKTDSNGYFMFQLPTQLPDSLTYMLQITLPAGYKTINTNPVIFSKIHRDTKEIVEFGLFPFTAPQITITNTPTPTAITTRQPSILVSPTAKPTVIAPSPTIKTNPGNSQGKSLQGD